ncbi:hypothetical protein Tco_0922851 [Tanacetum coccineum]|uniref:Uncharacterized protein n=1 Tax=Tanacetum coccineum TaxID=301880 RepID=A0ABQ5D248_9ASTR
MVFSSPCLTGIRTGYKELASPGSNSSRLSIHLVVYNEELAIPEQTATSKGTSNPLLAGSLPKTTKPTYGYNPYKARRSIELGSTVFQYHKIRDVGFTRDNVHCAASRIGRLLVGGGFAFSIMKNGIVNENYEETHKEKIDYEKANMRN